MGQPGIRTIADLVAEETGAQEEAIGAEVEMGLEAAGAQHPNLRGIIGHHRHAMVDMSR